YPATAQHAGEDLTPASQDHFSLAGITRTQAAVRDANARPGRYPLVIFSHAALQHRRGATFLTTHLSSHGYIVAALDHSEVIAPELARKGNETNEQKLARQQALIASRVPDIRCLIDHLLSGSAGTSPAQINEASIGIVGHSFGGWTALAVNDLDPR